MPDYKCKVKPILLLLSGDSDGVWKEEHTAALNHTVELVFRRLKLGLVDMRHGARIHEDESDLDCSTMMVHQGQDGDTRVVAMMGRELTQGKQRSTMFEWLLLCTCWAMKHQSCYVLYLPELTIFMPRVEETICV